MSLSIASITHYVNLFQFALFLNLHGGFSLRSILNPDDSAEVHRFSFLILVSLSPECQ